MHQGLAQTNDAGTLRLRPGPSSIFPLNIKQNPVALIYADRENTGEIKISEKELALLRTLRNQAVLAIKQAM